MHHLQRDVQRVGRDVVAGVEPEIVHQHLAQLFGDEGVVRQRVMVFGDAFLGPFVDAEVFGRKVDKLLVVFRDEDIFVSGLRQVGLKGL